MHDRQRSVHHGVLVKRLVFLSAVWFFAVTSLQANVVTQPVRVFGFGSLNALTMSPDGKQMVTVGSRGAFLWDLSTGQVVRSFAQDVAPLYAVAFSADGKKVVTGGSDSVARLWDPATGQMLNTFTGHSNRVAAVAISPDGTKVLTGSWDVTARLWDATTGQFLRAFIGHANGVTCVAFSPDGSKVLTGSSDCTARLWDSTTGGFIRTFVPPTNSTRVGDTYVSSVAFSADGTRVLTGIATHSNVPSAQNGAQLWDATTGQLLQTFADTFAFGAANVNAVAFSPDGTKVVTGGGTDGFDTAELHNQARLWDAASGQVLQTFVSDAYGVTAVAFSPDGSRVLTGASGNLIHLWNAKTAEIVQTFAGHSNPVSAHGVSPDGKRIVTAGSSLVNLRSLVLLWDVQTGQAVRPLAFGAPVVPQVVFSPDGTQVMTTDIGAARLWDVGTGNLVQTFAGQSYVAFAPDGTNVLVGASLVNKTTGQLLRTFAVSGFLNCATFSPDGSKLLTGADQAQLWDVATGELLRTFTGHLAPVNAVGFSVDGTRILTAAGGTFFIPYLDMKARLWDAASGQLLRTFPNADPAALSPDGTLLLAGSNQLLDASTGQVLRTFANTASVNYFSPDGSWIFTTGTDGTVQLWDIADLALRLKFTFNGAKLTLQWPRGVLQSASALDATWNDVPGATSPFVPDSSSGSQFYRVRISP